MNKNNKPNNEEITPHKIKIDATRVVRECKEAGIPIFLTYYVPPNEEEGRKKGYYDYIAVLPPEIDDPSVQSETDRFNRFLETTLDFNKDDYYLYLKKKEQ